MPSRYLSVTGYQDGRDCLTGWWGCGGHQDPCKPPEAAGLSVVHELSLALLW